MVCSCMLSCKSTNLRKLDVGELASSDKGDKKLAIPEVELLGCHQLVDRIAKSSDENLKKIAQFTQELCIRSSPKVFYGRGDSGDIFRFEYTKLTTDHNSAKFDADDVQLVRGILGLRLCP